MACQGRDLIIRIVRSLGQGWPRRGERHSQAPYVPKEARQFASDGDDAQLGTLSLCDQPGVASAQSQLRIPGSIDDRFGNAFVPALDIKADARGMSIAPGRFDQQFPCVAIAGLGNAALTSLTAGRVLRRGNAQPRHKLSGMLEAREIAELG